jgi:hypothetical protein
MRRIGKRIGQFGEILDRQAGGAAVKREDCQWDGRVGTAELELE